MLLIVTALDLDIVNWAEILGKGDYLCALHQCWMEGVCSQKGEPGKVDS